jgi:hypothetical protein
MPAKPRRIKLDTPATYCVRFQGALDHSWADCLGGMSVEVTEAPGGVTITTLTGVLEDQAALGGVLGTIYDLGLPLLSVERLEAG